MFILADILCNLIENDFITLDEALSIKPEINTLLTQVSEIEWHSILTWIIHEIRDDNKPSLILPLHQLLQLPLNERSYFKPLYLKGTQALANGSITYDKYFLLSTENKIHMWNFFTQECQKAYTLGFITLDRYLEIPAEERFSLMKSLFSCHGLKALELGFITLEQYLDIPFLERSSLIYLLSKNGIRALKAGFINFEKYCQIPLEERDAFKLILSDEGIKLLLNEVVTIDEYFSIEHNLRIKFINNCQNSYYEINNSILFFLLTNKNNHIPMLPECLQTYIAALTAIPENINIEKAIKISENSMKYYQSHNFFKHNDNSQESKQIELNNLTF